MRLTFKTKECSSSLCYFLFSGRPFFNVGGGLFLNVPTYLYGFTHILICGGKTVCPVVILIRGLYLFSGRLHIYMASIFFTGLSILVIRG